MNYRLKESGLTLLIFMILVSNSQVSLMAQSVEVIKFPELEAILKKETKNNKVINFWATWCRPCVKELPQFIDLDAAYKDDNLELILVSFDFIEDLETKLKPFVLKKNIQSKVYLLDETDYNSFIDKIDPSWSGAIPATLMINGSNGKRLFLEKEFEENELKKTYQNFIK